MKKEKWLMREIDRWQAEEIINGETADILKGMYQPKKNVTLLMVLFSIIGSVLIGMGIVLVSANNWWYSLPIAARTVIGFLPLLLSDGLLVFVLKNKMQSIAFRESAAILNMAGVFASIALVGQIFHLPGDFTNYVLICGILSMPSMLIMNALSPLVIFYWTAINGGVFFGDDVGVAIAFVLYIIGAIFALIKCTERNGKSVYLSLLTVVSGFVMIMLSATVTDSDISVVLFGFTVLLLSASTMLKGAEGVFEVIGRLCFIVMMSVATYRWFWEYSDRFESVVFIGVTVLLCLFATALLLKNIKAKEYDLFALTAFAALIMRAISTVPDLNGELLCTVFMIIFNVALFALSIVCLVGGVRRIDLYNANTGMITLCSLIIMRFFDSEMPLSARGVVFLILGAGFLTFNLYLVKTKKRIKEGTV